MSRRQTTRSASRSCERLIRRTKELDRTRLVTFVTDSGSVREHRAYADADLVAANIYPGSLGPPLADHVSQLDERAPEPAEAILRTHLGGFPDKPLLITEFGAMGFHGLHGPVASTEDFQAAYIAAVWTPSPRTRTLPAACSGRGPITTTAGISRLSAPSGRLEWSRSTASPRPRSRPSAMRSESKARLSQGR